MVSPSRTYTPSTWSPPLIDSFGNVTAGLPEAKWHAEPKIRGTSSILSSCLITMFLCTWTTIHLNLPEHKKESRQVYRKILWLVIGLLAPELVVWNAWEQRSQMKALTNAMKDMGFVKENKEWRMIGWIIRAPTEIKAFFLLKAKDWPELASPRENQELCHNRVHSWTDVHSWYVITGGLAFEDTAVEELQFMPGTRQRMALTDQT
ncbi:5019_t:CDS:1, partial [Scutellospora calospora]